MRLSLCLAVVALISAGCDAVDEAATPADAHVVTLDAPAGDVYYDLAPLAVGEALVISAAVGADRLALRSTRQWDGYDVSLDTGGLRPDAVTVTYHTSGQIVTTPVLLDPDRPFSGGVAKNEPTSWHWKKIGDDWILIEDFVMTDTGSSAFTTVTGETLEVTHVVFTLSGIDAPPPRTVEFESPRPITILEPSLEGGLAVSVGALH